MKREAGTAGGVGPADATQLPTRGEFITAFQDAVYAAQRYAGSTVPDAGGSIRAYGKVVELVDRLREAATRGRQDSARLDWLDEQREPVSRDGETLECYAWGVYGQNFDVRNAIDTAMSTTPSESEASPDPLPDPLTSSGGGDGDKHE